ncbi:MAG: integrase [Planctomycetaceae bacterium]|nr:MAG: integrase [Planctomycetaceae bacterium]
MVEDMQLRNLAPATIDAYTYHVDKFCRHFNKMADELGPEEIREFQLYLVHERKVSWSAFNQAVCGLRFLYEITLQRPWEVRHIPFGKRPKKLPVVLSDEEASRLFECLHNPKHRAVLLTCYAAGLRLREATHLRVADIDGQRQQIHVHNSKGAKDRMVPASPRLLAELRAYWVIHRPGNYLFPGKTPDRPLSSATVQKACKLGIALAGIRKAATPHTMRHSFATSMLEAGVDVLTISKLLGHSSFVTTMIYLHVRRQHFDRSPSPIDWLPVRQCPKWAEASLSESIFPQEPQPTNTSPSCTSEATSEQTSQQTSEVTEEATGDTPTEGPAAPIRRTSERKPRKKRRR